MTTAENIISFDRDEMSQHDKRLFLKDLQTVLDEYFECEDDSTVEITRTEKGFLVCVLFSSRRIKNVKHPL